METLKKEKEMKVNECAEAQRSLVVLQVCLIVCLTVGSCFLFGVSSLYHHSGYASKTASGQLPAF